jgi:hypothetical protein
VKSSIQVPDFHASSLRIPSITGVVVVWVAVYCFFTGSCPKITGRIKNASRNVIKILFMKSLILEVFRIRTDKNRF